MLEERRELRATRSSTCFRAISERSSAASPGGGQAPEGGDDKKKKPQERQEEGGRLKEKEKEEVGERRDRLHLQLGKFAQQFKRQRDRGVRSAVERAS